MTETLPASASRSRAKKRGEDQTTIGMKPHKRTGIDVALALLTPSSARNSWTSTTCAPR